MATDTKVNDGGPAFPQPMVLDSEGIAHHSSERGPEFAGLSLRDYFAAKAMERMTPDLVDRLAAPDQPMHDEIDEDIPHRYTVPPEEIARRVAVAAFLIADAMLKAREGK